MSVWSKDEDLEEEDANEEEEFRSFNDHIIFLIDSRSNMMQNTHDTNQPYIVNCLNVLLEVMKTKIISQDTTTIGLMFFGTREKDSPDISDNIFNFFPLGHITAQRIRQLKNLIENFDSEFSKTIGSAEGENICPLKQSFWLCSQSFSTIKNYSKADLKRIWLFTNDDNPNFGVGNEQVHILNVAKDIAQHKIEISLWALNNRSNEFNLKSFYNNLLVNSSPNLDEDSSSIEDRIILGGNNSFELFFGKLRKKEFSKRRLTSCYMKLIPNASGNFEEPEIQTMISVHLYKMISITKRPSHTWLYSKNHETLQSTTKYINSETGEIVNLKDLKTCIELAGSEIDISKDVIQEIKSLGNSEKIGLQVLEFVSKDSSLFDILNIHNSPYFVYPDDSTIKGSSELFEALLRETHRKGLYILIRFNATMRAIPRKAILIPQLEVVDESDGCQITPPGFQLIILPYVDELRASPLSSDQSFKVDESAKEAMKTILDIISFDSDFSYSSEIQNPTIQKYYSLLQAIALAEENLSWDPSVDDNLKLSEAKISEIKPFVEKLKELTNFSSDSFEVPEKSKKRSATSEENANKKAKTSDENDLTPNQIKNFAKQKKLNSFTVAQLKEMSKSLGLHISNKKKQELIDDIEGYF